MSVYTTLEHADLVEFLKQYDIGDLISFSGIESGIINSNFYVTTEHGKFVLTLFESLTEQDIPFFMTLMEHYAEHGLPCPRPIYDKEHNTLQALKYKPAVILNCLPGNSVESPSVAECALAGELLAKLHESGRTFTQQRSNRHGPAWWSEQAKNLEQHLSTEDNQLIALALQNTSAIAWDELPQGMIHADLFPDNVLFENGTITGVIDFYLACTGSFAYDLAITAIAWCTSDANWDPQKEKALMQAYEIIRPLTEQEHAAWPQLLKAAALRFWVSRLVDFHSPKKGELTHLKDPDQMKSLLLSFS